MTTFNQPGPRVDTTAVASLEARVGATLPADYREFLLSTNGGVPDPNGLSAPSQGGIGIRWFLSLGPASEDQSLTRAIDTWRDRHPAGMLPIAICEGSNLLLLALTGTPPGKVFYWDHDGEADEGEEPRFDNLTEVADSFTALLEALHDQDPRQDPRYRDIAGGTGTGNPDFIPTFD